MPNSTEIIAFGRFQDDKDSCKLQTRKKKNIQKANELLVVKRNKIVWNYCVIPSAFPLSKENSCLKAWNVFFVVPYGVWSSVSYSGMNEFREGNK